MGGENYLKFHSMVHTGKSHARITIVLVLRMPKEHLQEY
jgi:hypothetical protein